MKHSKEGEVLTDIILNTFRLNGLLLLEGDKLTEKHGVTSARWKVLGAISLSDNPITVPQIANNMGLSRQAVQRLVNEMHKDGMIDFIENPNHKKAKLLELTQSGKKIYSDLEEQQIPWVNSLAEDYNVDDLKKVLFIMSDVISKIESK